MIAHMRQRKILDLVRGAGCVSVHALIEELEASPATIRRDLHTLSANGLVKRSHGAVISMPEVHEEPTFAEKARTRQSSKGRIAEHAVGMIQAGETLFLDAGTTTCEIARRLDPTMGLKVITHSLHVLQTLADSGLELISTGGQIRSSTGAMVGPMTERAIQDFHFDRAFLGASGLSPRGLSTTEYFECSIKQSVMKQARIVTLVADAGKWDHPAAVQFSDWSTIDDWITDGELDRTDERLASLETKIHFVSSSHEKPRS